MNRQGILLGALLALSASLACARQPGEYLNTVRADRLRTPCRPFAADYAKGPLKVLFIAQERNAPREIVELKQRFNMEIDATIYYSPPNDQSQPCDESDIYTMAVEGMSLDEKMHGLYRQLEQRWDLIVFGANTIFGGALSQRAQYLVLQQVSEGTGLILFTRHGARSSHNAKVFSTQEAASPARMLAGVPFPLLTSYASFATAVKQPMDNLPDALVKTYRFGKGRVVHLTHVYGSAEGYWQGFHSLTPGFPYTYKEHTYYDYYLSLVAKAMLWAAPGKASDILPDPRNPQAVTLQWGALPATAVCGIFAIPDRKAITVKAELRSLLGEIIPLPDQKAPAGAFSLAYRMPQLSQGDYFLDYRFVSEAGTEYWGSLGVRVSDSPVAIQQVWCARPAFDRSQPFLGSVTLTSEPADPLEVRFEGVDCDGRVIFRHRCPVTERTIGITASLRRALVIPHYLRVELWNATRCLDISRQDFLVTRPDPLFPSIMWGNPMSSMLGEISSRQLRQAGFNVSLGYNPAQALRRDMLHMDFIDHLSNPDPKPTAKDPDPGFTNKEWADRYIATKIVPTVTRHKEYGTYYYNLGDENRYEYTREGIAPSELKAFRDYLKRTYGSNIQRLNQEWASAYAHFDEIPIPDVQQPMGMQDIPRKHLWMSWCEQYYADAHHTLATAIRQIDPAARVGAEGSLPGNLEVTLAGLEMWGPYPDRMSNALMRSFGKPELLRGNWWGAYVSGRSAKAQPLWDQVLSGGVNSSFYFTIDGSEGLLSCDLSYADYFERDQLPALREIQGGIGPLLNRTPVANMGVGILYSIPSTHAQSIDTRFGTAGSCRDGLLKFSEDTGISAFFYSEAQLLAGKLAQDGVRVLFMPQVLALSDRAAGALRQWVNNGGVLIADQQVGLRNERGAPRPAGVLDDLFGIRQDPLGMPKVVSLGGQRLLDLPVHWQHVIVDTAVTLTKGKAAALLDTTIPCVVTHNPGKGRTVFLNLSLGKILANTAGDPATRAFLLRLLTEAGIFTGLTSPPGYLVTRFRGEGYELLSCRISAEGREGEKLVLGKAYHVYDVRRGQYLGAVSDVVPSACAGRNNLFTLLPAKACAYTVTFPGQIAPGETPVVTLGFTPSPDSCTPTRLFRVRVLAADTTEMTSMRTFLVAGTAAVAARMPFAVNQTAGPYTLEVVDLLTGDMQTKAFSVKGDQP